MKVSRALATDGPCDFCKDLRSDFKVDGNSYCISACFCWSCLRQLNDDVQRLARDELNGKPWALGGKE